jgi:hypothetical protein
VKKSVYVFINLKEYFLQNNMAKNRDDFSESPVSNSKENVEAVYEIHVKLNTQSRVNYILYSGNIVKYRDNRIILYKFSPTKYHRKIKIPYATLRN